MARQKAAAIFGEASLVGFVEEKGCDGRGVGSKRHVATFRRA